MNARTSSGCMNPSRAISESAQSVPFTAVATNPGQAPSYRRAIASRRITTDSASISTGMPLYPFLELSSMINGMADKKLDITLGELLNSGWGSAEALERFTHEHPEILDDAAEFYLSMLAQAQETPEARERVNGLARILRRLRAERL